MAKVKYKIFVDITGAAGYTQYYPSITGCNIDITIEALVRKVYSFTGELTFNIESEYDILRAAYLKHENTKIKIQSNATGSYIDVISGYALFNNFSDKTKVAKIGIDVINTDIDDIKNLWKVERAVAATPVVGSVLLATSYSGSNYKFTGTAYLSSLLDYFLTFTSITRDSGYFPYLATSSFTSGINIWLMTWFDAYYATTDGSTPTPIDGSSSAATQITFERLLELLKITFNIDWYISSSKLYFIHPSERSFITSSIDFKDIDGYNYSNKNFTGQKEQDVRNELWELKKMPLLNYAYSDFYRLYTQAYTYGGLRKSLKYQIDDLNSNLIELKLNASTLEESGYAFVMADNSSKEITKITDPTYGSILNFEGAMGYLYPRHLKYDRPKKISGGTVYPSQKVSYLAPVANLVAVSATTYYKSDITNKLVLESLSLPLDGELATWNFIYDEPVLYLPLEDTTTPTVGITATFASGTLTSCWESGDYDNFVTTVELLNTYGGPVTNEAVQITGSLDKITSFVCDSSYLADTVDLSLLYNLTSFNLGDNTYLDEIIIPATSSAITSAVANRNTLSYIDFSPAATSDDIVIDVSYNAMNVTNVDSQIENLDDTTWEDGTLNINYDNAIPTSGHLNTEVVSLQGKGWDVFYSYPFIQDIKNDVQPSAGGGTGTYALGYEGSDDSVLSHITEGYRYNKCSSAGTIYYSSTQSLGTWIIDFSIDSASTFAYHFITNNTAARYSFLGYAILISGVNKRFSLSEIGGSYGASTTIMAQNSNSLVHNTYYTLKITRTSLGVFTIYIKGGSFNDSYVLVSVGGAGGVGTNPVTDNTHTTSAYQVLDLDSNDKYANIQFTTDII
jgi:hypothetical protein